jgi:predicted permease
MALTRIRLWLRALLNRGAAERELDEELRFHVQEQTRLFEQQGLSSGEARRRALLALGGVEATKETHRDGRGTRGIEETLGDLRYAARTLWRDRALAVAGVLTLALGIGGTTAVFSAVNAVMLRDLPFVEPQRLVAVWEENPDRGWYKNVVAPANYLDWRARVTAFEGVAAYTDFAGATTLLGYGDPQLITTVNVSGNFFSVLGVRPMLGTGLTDASDWDDGPRELVISSRLWRSVFRGDSSIVGRSISLGGPSPWRVAGVMPDGFAFPAPSTDMWVPTRWPRTNPQQLFFRRAHWMRTVARLRPGVSEASANAALQTVAKQLQAEHPQTNTRMGAGLTPLHEWVVGNTKRPLVVLLAAAAVLLLIACANVGNLLLVHALSRSRDVALRFALGATRGRVARQALTESLVLSCAGGAAGLLLGWTGARALLALQPTGMLPVSEISLDWRVLLFATALVAVSAVIFGVAPAAIATRQAPADALNSSSRTFTGGRVRRWGRSLVVAEVALAVILTVGAGLLMRSYDRLSHVEPGFDPTGVLIASLGLPPTRYDSVAKVMNFYESVMRRVAALPGVERVAATRQLPATTTSWSANLAISGRPPMEQSADIIYRELLGDYFRAMRVRLLAGRAFTEADNAAAPPVAIINEALARQYFPNEDPLGQRIAMDRVPDTSSTWRTIVGVVGSEHQASLAEPPRPEVYLPLPQNPTRAMTLVVRVADGRDPTALAPAVRRAVREQDSLLAITSLRPMTEVHADAMSRERFTSVLVLVFAVTGIVLALVGVFGVLAQLVQARWREMGIRLALGAQRGEVRWLIVRHGGALLSLGIAAGLLVSIWTTRLLATLLYEIRPTDPITYAGVAVLIGGVGLFAAWIPALRASTANPAGTLRAE